jgi:hypothetical protein
MEVERRTEMKVYAQRRRSSENERRARVRGIVVVRKVRDAEHERVAPGTCHTRPGTRISQPVENARGAEAEDAEVGKARWRNAAIPRYGRESY